MSVIDRSWSEPHGAPVVAPMLATGTAAHATKGPENAEPQRFLGIPVVVTRNAPRVAAPAGRPNHDATSLVNPLPAPLRPGANDRSAPRMAVTPDEHAARSLQRRSNRRRRRIAILAGVVAGLALACGVTVLSSTELDRLTAAPSPLPQQQQSQPRQAVVPAATPAAPAKPQHASTVTQKTAATPTVAAPVKTAATQPTQTTAAQPTETTVAATAKTAAAPTAKTAAAAPTKATAAPTKTVAAPKKTAVAPKRTAEKKPAKPAAPTAKKPALAKPAPAKPAPARLAPTKPAAR